MSMRAACLVVALLVLHGGCFTEALRMASMHGKPPKASRISEALSINMHRVSYASLGSDVICRLTQHKRQEKQRRNSACRNSALLSVWAMVFAILVLGNVIATLDGQDQSVDRVSRSGLPCSPV